MFYQDLPLCTAALVLVWFGVEQKPPDYTRIKQFDWRGALLVAIGFGAFTTMLEQGNRLDWFNSKLICVLALVSAEHGWQQVRRRCVLNDSLGV